MSEEKQILPPKTIPNPKFMEDEAVRDAIEEAIYERHRFLGSTMRTEYPFNLIDGMNQEIWSALPERGGCEIPEEGAWILVKKVPHTDLNERFEVPVLSIWRARPFYRNRLFKLGGKGKGRRQNVNWPMLLAIINTPGGELYLYPGEYSTIPPDRLEVYLDCLGREVNVHWLGAGEPGDLAEQLFYLMSHGIKRRDAMLLLLPSLTDENFCYFTIDL